MSAMDKFDAFVKERMRHEYGGTDYFKYKEFVHFEFKSLELELASTKKILDEAKEVIGFYADEKNWFSYGFDCKNVIRNDETILNDVGHTLGGKMARSFLAKHEKKEVVND